jgi:hypothetical protein
VITLDCPFCIDGNMPAGTDADLGELYERCLACAPVCADCDGLAVFPAAHHCLVCFIRVLLTRHLAPVLCPGCLGVITLIDITDTEATQ